jgi:hypothetical protein
MKLQKQLLPPSKEARKGNSLKLTVFPHGYISGEKVNELFIAGDDKVFYPADATTKGNKLIVTC